MSESRSTIETRCSCRRIEYGFNPLSHLAIDRIRHVFEQLKRARCVLYILFAVVGLCLLRWLVTTNKLREGVQCIQQQHSSERAEPNPIASTLESHESYSFVFSTGRCASQHMSRLFVSYERPLPVAYITHQEEDFNIPTREYVHRFYRVLAAKQGEEDFMQAARAFLRRRKIPFYKRMLARHSATRFVYTGHLPLVFGLGSALVDELAPAPVRILRLRRDRIASALSFLALGPETEDPWSPLDIEDGPPSTNRRWFPWPSSVVTRLRVTPANFRAMNRFQRWLWYVDDVECRWQAMKLTLGQRFEWMEESLEGLSVMDGGQGWRRVATFLGVDVDESKLSIRHNTIQDKGREKWNVSESALRDWDASYRDLVGPCDVHGDGSQLYYWNKVAV
jgi:hypothetical protein